MLKIIPAILAVFALAAFLILDFMGFKDRAKELARFDVAGVGYDALPEEAPSYVSHLLSKVGMGETLPERSEETALATRMLLHSEPMNHYLPQPDEDVLPEWERIAWSDDYHTGFGWPDGVNDPHYTAKDPALDEEAAIYLKGKHSVYVRVQYAEPTKVLAERLKQAYWVVETGRDLGKLLEAKPRASYFWTNVQQSTKGASVKNAKDVKHFADFDGVYFLTAKNKTARRDEKMRYMFASLGSGITIKVRAHAPESAIKEILAEIDFQSLNQMQTLPSPLIADGLADFILETPEGWLEFKGDRAADLPITAFDAPKKPKAAKPTYEATAKAEAAEKDH